MDYSSIFVCLMGMGTVFFGLICLIVLTSLMGCFCRTGREAPPAAPVPAVPAAPEPDRQELAAVIAAAIAEDLGTEISGIRIVSMKKV